MSGTAATVTVTGDLDLAERTQFPGLAARVDDAAPRLLVVDLCAATFVDSSGAAFLIALAGSARERGGTTVLRGPSERDLFVLQVCGSLDAFTVDTAHRCPQVPDGRGPWSARSDDGAAADG